MNVRHWRQRLVASGVVLGSLVAARAARAEPPRDVIDDGVYGRLDGDLDLSLSVGGAFGREGPGGALMARALFLETTGIYLAYTESFGTPNAAPPRTLALGLGLRPLFIPRWGFDRERGPAILDLTIDAITFDMGVLWAADHRGGFTHAPGIELAIGTEAPLAGRAAGPWVGVRGAIGWRGAELSGATDADPPLRTALFVTFAWHFMANVHLVDRGDESLR